MNLSKILTDSYSPAIILPKSHVKIHYSSLRHSFQSLSLQSPFKELVLGDVVSIALSEELSLDLILVLFSTISVGGAVNLVPSDSSMDNIQHLLNVVKSKVLICNKSNVDRFRMICSSLRISLYIIDVELVLRTLQLPKSVRQLSPTGQNQLSNAKAIATMICVGSEIEISSPKPKYDFDKDDLAIIFSTCGTTGKPKVVALSHKNISTSLSNISKSLLISPADVTILASLLTESHGLIGVLLASFFKGSTVILPGNPLEIDHFWSYAAKYSITWFSATPFVHRKILAKGKLNHLPRSIRLVHSTGSTLNDGQLFEMEKMYHAPIITSLTMTEAAYFIASNTPNQTRKLGSCGIPVASLDIMIVNQLLEPIRAAQGIGEICISGSNVFKGYLDTTPNSTLFFDYQGKKWFKTADMGLLDERGYLTFAGRKSDMIRIANGKLVFPSMLDRILSQHPQIDSAACFAVGNEIHAAIVPQNNSNPLNGSDLKDWLATMISSEPISVFHNVQALPRTKLGKIQRHILSSTFSKL